MILQIIIIICLLIMAVIISRGLSNSRNEQKEKTEDPFENKVKCQTCRCWLDKEDAQLVKSNIFISVLDEYYCQEHTKPYTEEIYLLQGLKRYRKMMIVDEQGEPIGYTKNRVDKK